MICSDEALSRLDKALAKLYRRTLQGTKHREVLLTEQRRWLQKRDACSDAPCVEAAYRTRLRELTELMRPSSGSPCSTAEGFDQRFGATDIAAEVKDWNDRLRLATVEPYSPWPPYTQFWVELTRNSGRVMGTTAAATFNRTETAIEFAESLIAAFRRDIRITEQIGELPGTVTLYTGTRGSRIKFGGQYKLLPNHGLEVRILVLDNKISLTCRDIALQRLDLREASRK